MFPFSEAEGKSLIEIFAVGEYSIAEIGFISIRPTLMLFLSTRRKASHLTL